MKTTSVRGRLLASTLLAGAGCAGVGAVPAVAADTTPTATTVQEVVVTGSHIHRRDYVSDSPIVTVTPSQIQSTGSVTLESFLNQVPQFTPAITSTSNNPSNGGQANVQLRNLGNTRTLVLIDGRRMQPSNASGVIDLNTVPDALIENVEVITGGASAAYGSDAMAGVVNIKLNHHFTGVQVDAQYGETFRGDGASQDVTATIGGNFADDKGNAVLSFDYSNRDGIFNAARRFSAVSGLSATTPYGRYDPGSNAPSQAAVNAVFANYGISPGQAKNTDTFGFNPGGTSLYDAGLNYKGSTALDYSTIPVNGNYNTGALNLLTIPLTRYNAYSRAEYQVLPDITAYGQLMFTNYTVNTQLAPSPASGNPSGKPKASPPSLGNTGWWIPATNPFIPADLATLLASRTGTTNGTPNASLPFLFADRTTPAGPRIDDNSYYVYQLQTGLKGKLGSSWEWDLWGSFGRMNNTETQYGNVSHAAVRQLLEAPDGGKSQCTGGLDLFGLSPISPSCLAFITRTTKNTFQYDQRNVEIDIDGDLFKLPAGVVKGAFGATYRSDQFTFVPDSVLSTNDVADIGTPLQTYAPGVVGFNAQNPLSGMTEVKEGYVEALIPALKDLPFVQKLNFDLGARYSSYNLAGGAPTYKADFEWTVVPWALVRGGYSHAFRAPNINDLFAPLNQNFPSIGAPSATGTGGDPCDVKSSYRKGSNGAQVKALCLAQGVPSVLINTYTAPNTQAQSLTGGNKSLKPEQADTYSIGLVLTPKFEWPLFRKLSGSIDYYNITIKQAIGTIGAGSSLHNCFNNGNFNPTYTLNNPYCNLVSRDPTTGQIADIIDTSANLGKFKTSGIDFQIDWSFGLGAVGLDDKYGALTLNTIGTWLNNFDTQNLPGAPFTHEVGTISSSVATAYPRWKWLTSVAYTLGPVEIDGRWRHIAKMNDFLAGGLAVGDVDYFDLTGKWKITHMLTFRGGINNLMDKQAPVYTSSVQANTDPSTYDVYGRRFFVALSAKF